ncbi:hypothetical protein [Anaerotignum sp.]|uniref:hypothetical protein n=1 Tax=Anaerotignum sp. TaxID=2039241 RepID=UPI003A8C0168
MVVNFDKTTKRVYWYNIYQSKEDAQSRLNETTIWIEGDIPEVEYREGYNAVFYVEDMQSIRVEYEPIEEKEPTMDEKIYAAVSKSQDEIRQEGADMVMEELLKRGLIV